MCHVDCALSHLLIDTWQIRPTGQRFQKDEARTCLRYLTRRSVSSSLSPIYLPRLLSLSPQVRPLPLSFHQIFAPTNTSPVRRPRPRRRGLRRPGAPLLPPRLSDLLCSLQVHSSLGRCSARPKFALSLSPSTRSPLRPTPAQSFDQNHGAAGSRTSSSKPLTNASASSAHSNSPPTHNNSSSNSPSSPALQRSLTSAAASKMKKALGLKSPGSGSGSVHGKQRKAVTVGELMRNQMRVPESVDSRVRRALLRISAGQAGNISNLYPRYNVSWKKP